MQRDQVLITLFKPTISEASSTLQFFNYMTPKTPFSVSPSLGWVFCHLHPKYSFYKMTYIVFISLKPEDLLLYCIITTVMTENQQLII